MSHHGSPGLLETLLAADHADRSAVQAGAVTVSYTHLRYRVAATADKLLDAGVTSGDRVLVLYPNSIEQIIAALAAIACDAIAVPIDPASGKGRIEDVTQQTGPRCCLAAHNAPVPAGMDTMHLRINDTVAEPVEPVLFQTSATTTHDPAAFIRFTSGSTGQARGVVIMQGRQRWIAQHLAQTFGLNTEHRELLIAPMAHSGGWQRVAATLAGGGCVVIGERPLSVGDLLDQVLAAQATGFFATPPLIRMLLASPADRVRKAMRGCRSIEIGSAPLQAVELEAFMARAPAARLYIHYGLTECSRATLLDAWAHTDKLDTVGTPLPGVSISIRDDNGQEMSANRTGQIHVRGPQLAGGYWRHSNHGYQPFSDGWVSTGDYGNLDDNGYLTLLGRHDDRINCGGHCFFPAEAEQLLGMPAGIEHYLIAGVSDPRGVLQDVPWAFVVPANKPDWSPREFLELARNQLPAHMVPRQVIEVPNLPLTASGKPDRRETVKLYAPRKGNHDE